MWENINLGKKGKIITKDVNSEIYRPYGVLLNSMALKLENKEEFEYFNKSVKGKLNIRTKIV